MKLKEKVNQIHEKMPYLEPILLFIISSLFGFTSNIFSSKLLQPDSKSFYKYPSFWICIVILGTVVVYYKNLSTYSFKYSEKNNRERIIDTYANLAIKNMQTNNINSFLKSTYIYMSVLNTLNTTEGEKLYEKNNEVGSPIPKEDKEHTNQQ